MKVASSLHDVSNTCDTFYVYDLDILRNLYSKWTYLLPDIQPYYAVKCNPDRRILQTLAACGANFDCASPYEISLVMQAGVEPSRILYANPCKRESDITYMKKMGVTSTTADSVCELDKLARIYPDVNIILRIYANDPTAQCVLSNKFGAFKEEWEPLLQHAAKLQLSVVGVSFHVGSGACNPQVFRTAIEHAKEFCNMAARYGFDRIHTIDIGGGFSVGNIDSMARAISASQQSMFPKESVRFIAEPGRYFAETIATLYTKIMGVRERRGVRDYFIPDSLYGSFNCILYDHVHPIPQPASTVEDPEETIPTTIFGPTCDGFDKIAEDIRLPRMQYGDWLVWKNMGAYTIAGACDFNGIQMTAPKCVYLGMPNSKI